MGSSTIDTPGAQCTWDDLASEPIIIFPQAEANRTYIALGMQLSINLTSLDPMTVLASSKLYLSYIQSNLRVRPGDTPILISDINPLAPFQMSGPSSSQPQLLVTLLFVQPHPLLVDDTFTQAFAAMQTDVSKRQNFNFETFCESSAITILQANTWAVVNGTSGNGDAGDPGIGGGVGGSAGGSPSPTPTPTPLLGGTGEIVTTIFTTDANGQPVTITSTIADTVTTLTTTDAAGNPTVITSILPGSAAAAVTTISTTDAAGNPTLITSTLAGTPTTILTTDSLGNPTTLITTLPPGVLPPPGAIASGTAPGAAGGGASKAITTVIDEVTVTISDTTGVFTSTITFESAVMVPGSSVCEGGAGGKTVTATVTVDEAGVPVGTS
ncbi:hypothetical protein C8A05DRAFT_37384, partial [Staphylotrichum tortipilum]